MQKIITFLWFDNQAEEAVKFYTSVIKPSKIRSVSRYAESVANAAGRQPGSVMTIEFELAGQKFMALNGGPQFKFTEAISLMVYCATQAELDRLWNRLSAGGKEIECGWLKDKYGLAWQIVPSRLPKWLGARDAAKTRRVMEAVLKMKKLNIKKLEQAYAGKTKKA